MTYDQAVHVLTEAHYQSAQPPTVIYAFPDPANLEIRLIEVTDLVPDIGELYPIAFGPTADMPFRTVVAQVTPAEWDAIERDEIELPAGWVLAQRQEVHA
ncbi:MAG: hypothetical protein WCP21_16430 [Armatimonadota bacterium]